ncbi:MAG: hypothetical protein IJL22_04355, partial [Bacteroidales bacterium]|nr:hypothetical protein [Bacteroidales bacterium]
ARTCLFLRRRQDFGHFPARTCLFLRRRQDFGHFPARRSHFLRRRQDFGHFPARGRKKVLRDLEMRSFFPFFVINRMRYAREE